MAVGKIGINGNIGSALERGLKRAGCEVKAVGSDKSAVHDTALWASGDEQSYCRTWIAKCW